MEKTQANSPQQTISEENDDNMQQNEEGSSESSNDARRDEAGDKEKGDENSTEKDDSAISDVDQKHLDMQFLNGTLASRIHLLQGKHKKQILKSSKTFLIIFLIRRNGEVQLHFRSFALRGRRND